MTDFRRMRPLLGTFVEIGSEGQGDNTEAAVTSAFATIELLHHLLSFHEVNSDLSRINQSKGQLVDVHHHTLRVIKLARAMTVASKGLFNCTVGGALVAQNVLPNHAGTHMEAYGNASDIMISDGKIQLKRSVQITLDGIAKGYAVDCAIATLKRNGVKSGWVNAGGDLRVYGKKALPISRREVNGELISLGTIQNAAVATSVVNQEYDPALPGKVISETITPQLGAWTVVAHMAWRADALTKVACLASENERNALIATLGGVVYSPTSSPIRS